MFTHGAIQFALRETVLHHAQGFFVQRLQGFRLLSGRRHGVPVQCLFAAYQASHVVHVHAGL